MNNNEDLKLHSILDENIGKFGFADEAGNVVMCLMKTSTIFSLISQVI